MKLTSFNQCSYYIGASLLLFVACLLMIPSLLLGVNVPISPLEFWIILFGSGIGILLICRKYFGMKPALYILSATFLLIFCSIFVSQLFYDVSYDGQSYHQEAVIQLANGWNPYYTPQLPTTLPYSLWINHYAKGPWICEAVIYKALGNIESGKAIHLILIIAAFLLVYPITLAIFQRTWQRILYMLFVVCNPVAITQMFSYYVDGILASLLVCLLAVFYHLYTKPSRLNYILLAACIALIVNIKFTGIPIVLFILLPFLFAIYVKRKALLRPIIGTAVLACIVGVCVIGYQPYITNTISNGNPFYPLMGAGKVDIITVNSPRFTTNNSLAKLFDSTFSTTANSFTDPPALKIPLFISTNELLHFAATDVRIGGFGPWFGLLLILGIFALSTGLYQSNNNPRRPLIIAAIFAAISLFISVLLIPENWWARYAPQFWLLPLLGLLVSHLQSKNTLQRILACSLWIVIGVNILLVSAASIILHANTSYALHKQLTELSQRSRRKPIAVTFQAFPPNRVRFMEKGIQYIEIPNSPSLPQEKLIGSDTVIYSGQ